MQKGLVSKDTSPRAPKAWNPSASLLKTPGPSELSWRRDLNPRPSDYKSDALPTELRQHCANRTKLSHRHSNCKRLSDLRQRLRSILLTERAPVSGIHSIHRTVEICHFTPPHCHNRMKYARI